jgi:acyl-CoA dehydrogenase
MDDETYTLFFEQLQRFVHGRLVPAEQTVIEGDRIPDSVLAEMRDMGLFGLTIPTEYGGIGLSVGQYVRVIQELSWAIPAYRAIISLNAGMICAALLNSGTKAQRDEWLPRLAAGEVASFALSEPDSGSDSAGLRTRAVREADGYVLNGTKRYITNAPFASVVLVMARTTTENLPKNQHVSAFLVPTDLPGVDIGKPDRKMGQAGAQIADVVLRDVRVPASALLGEQEGIGFRAAMQSLDNGRMTVAAAACGYAKRILEAGVRYATERKAFGEPIAGFQLIQALIADSYAEIYASECMIRDLCTRVDRGERVSVEASCAKMFATEMCGRVADRVVQIHGGAGYLQEYEAERFYRDVRVLRIYEGTTQIQQLLIAKAVLRQFAESGRVGAGC